MTSVLVTGGAGYIGSHACKALAADGFLPIAFDNLSHGHRWAVRWGPLECHDLADIQAIRHVIRRYDVKAVMHFAASAYVGESMSDPAKYFRNNVTNSLNLFEAMIDEEVKHIVLSSSCASYGIPKDLPIDENHPQHPVNPYGESKMQMERMAAWFAQIFGLRWIGFRYFNAAGADPDGEIGESHDPETHLIPLAIKAAFSPRHPLKIFGTDYPTPDGTAIRDFIHVSDLAAAHLRGLHYLLDGGESMVFNLGIGEGSSVRDVVRVVEQITGHTVAIEQSDRRAGDPPSLLADTKRANQFLNWRPRYTSLRDMVETAVAWHEKTSFLTLGQDDDRYAPHPAYPLSPKMGNGGVQPVPTGSNGIGHHSDGAGLSR